MDMSVPKVRRFRSTKLDVDNRRSALVAIVMKMQPMTVRQVFYQATVLGLVDKSESGYDRVQTDLAHLRRMGALPFDWIADNTRSQLKPRTFSTPMAAIKEVARSYRKSLWYNAPSYVEVWLEKDALSGVIFPETAKYDVPLMVARGYSSLSFLHVAAQSLNRLDVPAFVYHLGDFDPSGVNAGEKINQTLREMAPNAEIHFERLAVLPEQIEAWSLPTRPTKQSDSRAKAFGDISVELDAIEPDRLRGLVEAAIKRHLPAERLEDFLEAEEAEREWIQNVAARL